MHAWIVRQIVGGYPLRPGLAALKWLLDWATLSTASARDPRSDGNPRPRRLSWTPPFTGALRKWQQVVASGTGAKRPGAQHSIKSNRSFNARASFGVPLPDQQTREVDQRIIPLRPDPEAPQRTLACRRKPPPVHWYVNPGQNLVRTSSVPIRSAFDTNHAKTGASNYP